MSTTTLQNSQQRLDEVLHLAALGWKVFPVEANDKKPAGSLVSNGFKDATIDPGVIETWASRKAELNWGIAPPLSVLVLDLDADGSGTTTATFPGLEKLLAANSMSTVTPRKGKHIYVKVPEDWARTVSPKIGLIPGLDLRGIAKSYVLAPPSYINKPYQWIGAPVSPDQLLEAPAELLEWISKKQTTLRPTSSGAVSTTKGGGCATGWLNAVIIRVSTAPEGSRHKRLRGAAITAGGFIAAGRLDELIARAALIDAGLQCGLPEQQSRNVVDWGIASGLQYPIADSGNWKSQSEVGQKFSMPKWARRSHGR